VAAVAQQCAVLKRGEGGGVAEVGFEAGGATADMTYWRCPCSTQQNSGGKSAAACERCAHVDEENKGAI